MKSKFGLVSVALAAASVLFGSAEASASGGSWWGRAGYDCSRITDLRACIDDRTLQMRVAFRSPGSASFRLYRGFDVAASIRGDVMCDDHRGDDGFHSGWLRSGKYVGYGPRVRGLYSGYGQCDDQDIVPISGYRTDREIAYRERGNWYFVDLDLEELGEEVCHSRYVEDIYVDRATVLINGRRFYLDATDLELCGYDDYGHETFYDSCED